MKLIYVLSILSTFLFLGCDSGSGGGLPKGSIDNNGDVNYKIKNSKSYNQGPIVLFGDSLARGVGASSSAKGLSGCLESLSKSSVFNYAQDGATSVDAVLNLSKIAKSKASLVLVSVGGNDVIVDAFEQTLPEEKTFENIRKIFKSFTEEGSLVIHLGLNPPSQTDYGVEINTERLPKIKQIAIDEGVIFVEDSLKGLWGDPIYMADDVHPNDKGYEILCQRVKDALKAHF